MKRLLTLLVLLVLPHAFAVGQTQKRIDSLMNKGVIQDSGAMPATAPWGKGEFRSKGVDGPYYIDHNGQHLLYPQGAKMSAYFPLDTLTMGDSTIIVADTTDPGFQTIWNGKPVAGFGMSVVYSAVNPDTFKVDSTQVVTVSSFNSLIGWWGSGLHGHVEPSADTSLSGDLMADTLILNAGIDVTTNGYRVFARVYIGDLAVGAFRDTGIAGANGGNGVNNVINSSISNQGTAGGPTTGKADAYLFRQAAADLGGNGGTGTSAGTRNGNAGSNGATVTNCVGDSGAWAGKGGGNVTLTGGVSGTPGACTAPIASSGRRLDPITAYWDRAFSTDLSAFSAFALANRYTPGSAGGGEGARGISGTSGGGYCIGGSGSGGSSGQPGGKIWLALGKIVGKLNINVKGGKAGKGGDGGNASAGTTANESGNGGGGGGGGNGGRYDLFYHDASSATIAADVTGGDGGAKGVAGVASGTGAVQGQDGFAGNVGRTGHGYLWKL